MSKVKTILMGTAFLIPAAIVAVILILILASFDYGPDPGTEVGTTLWGTWALCCGYYFKNNRFYLASVALLGFAVLYEYLVVRRLSKGEK